MKPNYLNYLIFLVLLAIGPAYGAPAETVHCDFCGKTITGRFFTYSLEDLSVTICMDCDRTLPHCAACKLPYRKNQVVTQRGEVLCRACLARAIYCELCGKRIEGKYYTSKEGDEHFCQKCYLQYPKCMACGKPGPVQRLEGGVGVCAKCLPHLQRCASCGKPITGTYYKFASSDKVYCAECKEHRPQCYACGTPLGKSYWVFQDGRKICPECNSRAIIDERKIRSILDEVRRLAAQRLGLRVETPYAVRVQQLNKTSSEDAAKAKQGESMVSPLFGKELGLYRRMNGISEIFLLYGLPVEMIYETAAHEYTHAWQAENCPPDQSPQLREGFAQWVAGEILKLKGYTQALERLEARDDDPYGTGYQKIKTIERNLGRAALLEYVKTVKS
ncbi:MAG TPA: protein DA1 [bacterium]|nr:protein DA1 [bacterium]HPO99248.1 protein DA1 [bacterium]